METRLIFQLLLLLLLLAGEIHQEQVGASAASLVSSADEAGARHHRKLLQDFTVQLSQAYNLEIPVATTVLKGKSSPIHPAVNKESILPAVIKRRSSPIHPGPKHVSAFENGSPPSIDTKQAVRSGTPSNGKIIPGPPPTRNTIAGRLDSVPSSPIHCTKPC
ncbi:hypothetical protein SELMODRAFT_408887 [Selaginella moellendorffii]|uniref:Uncharacterized protein n=1 Tax=Selaginella moellendorffii TaxID=88036 RepID=D8RA95_SELML|nr:hypothetical protein SELMODRAFT_408887 [Selaginella moellendorffii]